MIRIGAAAKANARLQVFAIGTNALPRTISQLTRDGHLSKRGYSRHQNADRCPYDSRAEPGQPARSHRSLFRWHGEPPMMPAVHPAPAVIHWRSSERPESTHLSQWAPIGRSLDRTFGTAWRRLLRAHGGHSGAPRRPSNADIRSSVVVAAQMAAAGGTGISIRSTAICSLRHRRPADQRRSDGRHAVDRRDALAAGAVEGRLPACN
jgi:hypothetical protein